MNFVEDISISVNILGFFFGLYTLIRSKWDRYDKLQEEREACEAKKQ